jgi:dipeptidyl aminopeptidase/acylaminoacyl peptidase
VLSASRRFGTAAARLLGAILAAVFVCGGCAVERVPIGAGPPFLRSAGLVRVSDLRAVSPPAWSPDGRRLAFSTADGVWTVEAAAGDAGRRHVASLAGVSAVAWSPDGRALAVLTGGRVLTIALDDPVPRDLLGVDGVRLFAWPGRATAGGDGPAYAVAAAGGTTVWAERPQAGRSARTIRLGALPAPAEARALVWLDGAGGVALAAADRVAFLRADGRGRTRIEMLPAGGRDATPSPDGRFIAYLAAAPGDGSQVAVMRADGTGRRVLTPAGRYAVPAWSPSGTLVAVGRWSGDHAVLEVADALTGERLWIGDYRPEAAPADTPLAIVWAPDGLRLAFGTDTGATAGFVWLATLERR